MATSDNEFTNNFNEYFDSLYKVEPEEFKKQIIESLRANAVATSAHNNTFELLSLNLKMFKISSFLFTVSILRKIGEEPSEETRRTIAEMYRLNYNEISELVEESFRETEGSDKVIPYELFKELMDEKKKEDQ